MTDFKFDNIEDLKRDRGLEGETGISIRIKDGLFIMVRAASDANTAWKEKAPKVLKEIRRLGNLGEPEENIRALYAGLYADALLFGWHGGKNDDGTPKPGGPTIGGSPIAYTPAAGKAFLLQADDATKAIEDYCYDTKNFRAARADAIIETVGKD